MTVDQVIQIGTEAITLGTIVLTYLGTRKGVNGVHELVNAKNDTLAGRVDQLSQSIQDQGGKIPPSPPQPPSKV